jgi:hypothetical protein
VSDNGIKAAIREANRFLARNGLAISRDGEQLLLE